MNFQKAFIQCYDLTQPVVELGRLPHWVGIKERFNFLGLDADRMQAYIPDGYFYAVSTPAPSLEKIKHFKENARSIGADSLLIPCVIDASCNEQQLIDEGGIKIPASPEVVVNFGDDSIDELLPKRITRLRYRDMCRLVRKADEAYTVTEYSSSSQNIGRAIEDVSLLHGKHAIRYGSPTDIFRQNVLQAMVETDEKSEMFLFVRRVKDTGNPVQGMITFWNQQSKTVVYLSQAIDRDSVPLTQNIYRASFLELFRLAQQRGYQHVSLGRGNADMKVNDLGGDQVLPQSHLVFPLTHQSIR